VTFSQSRSRPHQKPASAPRVAHLGERSTPCLPVTASLHVVTADPDAVLARALASEARVLHVIVDQSDYPWRDFTVADPDGNHCTFATFAG
jgi:hypothetical protein